MASAPRANANNPSQASPSLVRVPRATDRFRGCRMFRCSQHLTWPPHVNVSYIYISEWVVPVKRIQTDDLSQTIGGERAGLQASFGPAGPPTSPSPCK